jgi:CheY-like chemotaxis protein
MPVSVGGDVQLTSRLGVGTLCRITFFAQPLIASQIDAWQIQSKFGAEASALMEDVLHQMVPHNEQQPASAGHLLLDNGLAVSFVSDSTIAVSAPAASTSSGASTTSSSRSFRPPPVAIPKIISLEQWHPRVLIMEDNTINMKVLKRMLEGLGCICSPASNGMEGVKLFKAAYVSSVPVAETAYEIVCTVRRLHIVIASSCGYISA